MPVQLTRDRIKGDKLFLYQAKTKQSVMVPIPLQVIEALKAIDDGNPYYFWMAIGKLKSSITEWQARLKRVS